MEKRYGKVAHCAPVLVLLAIVLVRCAWQSDDAYITFRTVANFWHGYGLRWNPAERVQTYSNPLWMMVSLLCFRTTGDVYGSTMVVSIVMTLSALAITAWASKSAPFALLAIVILGASGAVVDYAACGLENPLVYMLLALAVACARGQASPRAVGHVALLAGLIAVTRQDAALLVAPALAYLVWQSPSRKAAAARACAGLVPLVLWEAFSIIYYGYLIPNTAYAKLKLHVPTGELLHKGLTYALDSFTHDPLTLSIVLLAAGFALARGRGVDRWLSAGIWLYLAYVVRVGGDFMSGRFFSWIMFVAVPLLEPLPFFGNGDRTRKVSLAVAALALALPSSRWLSGADYGRDRPPMQHVRETGIADERGYYYPFTGLLPVIEGREEIAQKGLPVPPYPEAQRGAWLAHEGQRLEVTNEVGFLGYFGGPRLHVIDLWALADPLLAHIPFTPTGSFRPGHYPRPVPRGYVESAASDTNKIEDPKIAAFYDKVRVITRAPLWSRERLRTIFIMNVGGYDSLLANAGSSEGR